MKKVNPGIMIVAVILLILSVVPALAEEDTLITMNHFKLTLPGSWVVDAEKGPDQLKYFKTKKGSPSGGYFMITQYEGMITSGEDSSVTAFFLGLCSGFADTANDKKEEHEELEIDGNRGILIEYTSSLGGQDLHFFVACTVSGQNGVLMVYVNPDLSVEEARETFRGIVSTIDCTD